MTVRAVLCGATMALSSCSQMFDVLEARSSTYRRLRTALIEEERAQVGAFR